MRISSMSCSSPRPLLGGEHSYRLPLGLTLTIGICRSSALSEEVLLRYQRTGNS